ncbi:hypothetical protein AC481_03555 [miscellaneous Crenarchaeota group archaeon SMTZ-80]|nr:MAG: hypothetical protein AC481_03555 [miscellaneous Crenarchaeota group archaeon SMTZ-80]
MINFSFTVGEAKKLRRTGWKREAKIMLAETIAEHMYRVTILAMVISDIRKLDTEKVIKMSLLHDLSEVLTGDLTPVDRERLGIEETLQKERKALEKILNNFPKKIKENYLNIWIETQKLETDEARLVNSIDKLEMAIQAIEYIRDGYDENNLRKFIISAEKSIKDPQILRMLKNLKFYH